MHVYFYINKSSKYPRIGYLRILHLSHESLPDWRVEKSALTGLHHGHEVLFAGSPIVRGYSTNTFSKIYVINWTSKARYGIPFYWNSVKKQFENVIKDARPDLIHAHNIFSAKMISEFSIPFVYDDHEYWSNSSKVLKEMEDDAGPRQDFKLTNTKDVYSYFMARLKRIRRKVINQHAIRLWTKWERQLVTQRPTITVSERIASDFRLISKNNKHKIFVVPNFPVFAEVRDIKIPTKHNFLSSVYAGGDGYNRAKFPQKNIDGLINLFSNNQIGTLSIIGWNEELSDPSSSKIKYTGFLSRQHMFDEMSEHSIGLIPWKNHWSHIFASPNKAYEYAHAGLFVMCSSSLNEVVHYLKKDNCLTFENWDQMVSQLNHLKDNLDDLYHRRLGAFEFARSNLLWDKYENNILNAYQLC